MRSTTVTQFRAWMIYLQEEFNNPSRSDYYLMSIATDIRRSNAKYPSQIKMESSKLSFTFGEGTDKPTKQVKQVLSVEEATRLSKARTFPMLGLKPPE